MKKIILMSLVLGCHMLFANDLYHATKKQYTESKEIHKEFIINNLSTLFIANQYGAIKIVTDENITDLITFDIKIKVSGDEQEEVKKRLEQISIDFSQTPDNEKISARTNIKKKNSFFDFLSRSNTKMQIDYVVSLPINNKITLENTYGDIFLNKTLAELSIKAQYGSVYIDDSQKTDIKAQYSPNVSIKKVTDLTIRADYSNLHIEQANNIHNTSDYTNTKVNTTKHITCKTSYGLISINSVQEANIRSEYGAIHIDKIYKYLDIDSDFGTISVNKISPQATKVKIQGEYSPILAGYDPKWGFNYSFSTDFSKISIPENLPTNEHKQTITSMYVAGTKGNENNLFQINSNFGDIKINEINFDK